MTTLQQSVDEFFYHVFVSVLKTLLLFKHMRIYFSGIGGVGIGPLAQLALDAGYDVVGSDMAESPQTKLLTERGARVYIGQTGEEIRAAHAEKKIDRFVYTAFLSDGLTELQFAEDNGITTSKRDGLLAEIIQQKNLKLVAVSGTHGKTTTTGMLIWAFKELGLPISYSVGSTLSFGPSGAYDPKSEYFIYEADEFDRNMLHFEPHLTLITSLDHDHVDTYPTVDDYRAAFVEFLEKSGHGILWERDFQYLKTDPSADLDIYDEHMNLEHLKLAGLHNRQNAFLVENAVRYLLPDTDPRQLVRILCDFPGTGRRMEKLADNLYSDYGHHPVEIKATLQLAKELNHPVVLVYQPHQNIRQYEIKNEYPEAVKAADKIYWLPTYLSREDGKRVLTPAELTEGIDYVTVSELDETLWQSIQNERAAGNLILIMGAGSIDTWIRSQLDK